MDFLESWWPGVPEVVERLWNVCGTFVERLWNVRSLISGYLVDSGVDSGPGKSFLLFQSSTGEEVREAK